MGSPEIGIAHFKTNRKKGEINMAKKEERFEKFGFDEVFGRSAVMELLELKGSGASKLLSNLVQADIIGPVSGHGKGNRIEIVQTVCTI